MGGGRAQVNKAHKSRFASKASRHAHKIGEYSFSLVPVSSPPSATHHCLHLLPDKVRSGKSETSHRAAVKGARAARIQQSKAVSPCSIMHICPLLFFECCSRV